MSMRGQRQRHVPRIDSTRPTIDIRMARGSSFQCAATTASSGLGAEKNAKEKSRTLVRSLSVRTCRCIAADQGFPDSMEFDALTRIRTVCLTGAGNLGHTAATNSKSASSEPERARAAPNFAAPSVADSPKPLSSQAVTSGDSSPVTPTRFAEIPNAELRIKTDSQSASGEPRLAFRRVKFIVRYPLFAFLSTIPAAAAAADAQAH